MKPTRVTFIFHLSKRIKQLAVLCILMYVSSLFLNPLTVQAFNAPQIQSESAIILDTKTNQILYEKNAYQQMYPASITKIVTGIVALEKASDLSEKATVSAKARNIIGTRVYLLENEEMALSQLLQGLLVSSGNDAAIVIAEHLSGSVEAFTEEMNTFVRETVGVRHSNFSNPHGLFSSDHYTTAYDMARISAYAMQNESFREIVGTNMVEWKGDGWETEIYNHNRLIRQYEGATGLKNGFVSQSGYTLVAAAKRDGREIIAVTLNAPSADIAYRDMTRLLDYSFDAFEVDYIPAGQEYFHDNILYTLPEDYLFTIPAGEEWTYQFEEGVLQILSSEGQVIASSPPLQKMLEEEEIDEALPYVLEQLEAAEEALEEYGFFWWHYLLMLLSLAIVTLGVLTLIKRIRSRRKRLFY